MKKLVFILMTAAASNTFGDIINCPTLDNYSVNGKQWQLSLEKSRTCGGEKCASFARKFYPYDPLTKKVKQYGSKVTAIHFDITDHQSIQNEEGITLQCMGTYSSSEQVPGHLFGHWNTNETGNLKAELLFYMGEYKGCAVMTDSKSFDCSK